MITNSTRSASLKNVFLDLDKSGPLNKTTMETHTPPTRLDAQLLPFLTSQLINKVELSAIPDFMVTLHSVTIMVISLSLITTISKRSLLS